MNSVTHLLSSRRNSAVKCLYIRVLIYLLGNFNEDEY